MKRIDRLIAVALIAGASVSIAAADTLRLRDGQSIEGTFLGGTARQVRIEINGQIRTYDIGLIRSVTFAAPAENPPERGYSSAPPVPPEPFAPPAPPAPPAPRVAEAPSSFDGPVIPADTPITVRMVDSVNSETSRLGQTFMASVDEPVMVDDRTLIPRGADVVTKLVDDQSAGTFQGRAVQTLGLVSVRYHGQWVDLTSTSVRTESGSQGAKTGKIVGGTAVLGAILGGIAGGGKGAAIGTVSGAAVGAGAAAVTSGEKVVIPSETRLTFRLRSAAHLPD